jgi:hypothetical protein
MRFAAPACSLLLFAAAFATGSETGPLSPRLDTTTRHGVAYFEPPRSIGTPLDELARNYTGHALADRIAGRLRLDTDVSLHPAARDLIRRRLAERNY